MITRFTKKKKPKWRRNRKSLSRRIPRDLKSRSQRSQRDLKSRSQRSPRDPKCRSQRSPRDPKCRSQRSPHDPKSRCPKRRDRKSLWRRGPRSRSQKSVFFKQRPSTRALRGKVPRSLRISVEAKLSPATTKPCTAALGIRMEFTRGRRKRNEKKEGLYSGRHVSSGSTSEWTARGSVRDMRLPRPTI
jgi:hypothetical protein